MSFRVSGMLAGRQIRKNFKDRSLAESAAIKYNADALATVAAVVRRQFVETTLSTQEVEVVESAKTQAADRWTLSQICKAGIKALESAPDKSAKVSDLLEEWLLVIDGGTNKRWLSDLQSRNRRFVADNPGITTDQLSREKVRRWLDDSHANGVTRSHYRGCLHKFFGWLVERGYLAENPASGIKLNRKRSEADDNATPPTILTPEQAGELCKAFQASTCKRSLGWMVLCLFCGLRPEAEASRLQWSEVNFRTGEINVLGRKRGARLRTFKATKQAMKWLGLVKEGGAEQPGYYSRRAHRGAVELANVELGKRSLPLIVWDEDLMRHTYASYRSSQVPVSELADQMGTSPDMIYRHYRQQRPAAEVKAFFGIMP